MLNLYENVFIRDCLSTASKLLSRFCNHLFIAMQPFFAVTHRPILASAIACCTFFSLSPTHAADYSPEQLADMNLEQLLGATVTSVARREEQLAQSPAAVQVITPEEVRRSGATSIPEVLRLVPGLQVGRVDSHNWAISSRGFNDLYANKLLVLIDGRSVYTPLFSGVYWDAQDVMLEDIERIEVIRGPGAALWGANAVNGVINVITKKTASTQGFLATVGGGNYERGFGAFRYGGKLGDSANFRVFGKYSDRGNSLSLGGGRAEDAWGMGRIGFRIDWDAPDSNLLTLQGDIYSGREDQLYRRLDPTRSFTPYFDHARDSLSGGNIIARWTHTVSQENEFTLQTYYDRTNLNSAVLGEKRDTFDIDFQHRFPLGERQTIVWGGGYRWTQDELRNSLEVAFAPDRRASNLFSAFVQDEITIARDLVTLTLGSKFEHNDYTGFEIQPNARLLWTPTEKTSVWTSVARAVRTPSRADHQVSLRAEPVTPRGALFRDLPLLLPRSTVIRNSNPRS